MYHQPWETAFGYTRNFLNNRFVYTVVSPRAHGLAVGINMSPERQCNFDCVYCEVNRLIPPRDRMIDVGVMVAELEHTMELALEGRLRGLPAFQMMPPELLTLRHVVLSGDGEPTLCPNFCEVVQAVVHLRALGKFPFFKLVLVTNSTGFENPSIEAGLSSFTPQDEIWAKLDAGTPEYFAKINRSRTVPFSQVLANILMLGRQRSIVIQSLFCRCNGEEPPAEEIEQYVNRLSELKEQGARIGMIQVYSALRPTMQPDCGHLSLKALSRIAQAVRAGTGLPVEVF